MVDVILGSKNDGAYFTQDTNNSANQRMNYQATVVYTAGHVVKERWLWQRAAPSGPVSIEMSIYDISAGRDGSVPIYSETISSDAGTGSNLYIGDSGLNDVLSGLSGGEILALAITSAAGGNTFLGRRVELTASLSAPGATPNNPWSETGTVANQAPDAYFVLGEAGPQLSAPASISPGETISFTCSFVPTSVTASDGTSTLPLTNIVNTSGFNYTAVVPALPAVGQSLQYTTFGAVTMSATDGTDTAEDTTTLVTSQFPITILGATFDTGELSWLYNFNPDPEPVEQGDQGTPRTAGITLNSDGGYVADSDGSYDITVIDKTDGIAQTFSLLVGPAASAIGRITRRNLTRRAITRRSLTARP